MVKKTKSKSKSKSKSEKKKNLVKLAKESINNDKKLKDKISECMIEYAKTKGNMNLMKKIKKLSNSDKLKLSKIIKKEKKKNKKKKKNKTKSKRIKSGSAAVKDNTNELMGGLMTV